MHLESDRGGFHWPKGYNTRDRAESPTALFSPVPNRCTTAVSVALKHTQSTLVINSPYPGSTFTSVSTHSAWLLFTFPSRYLFAIGHAIIFSFRRALPPN